jgi:hypothetical protein
VRFIVSRAVAPVGPPMIQFPWKMEKQRSGVPERISVMPNEMEKLIRELPRHTEIVALFKRINDEYMMARS